MARDDHEIEHHLTPTGWVNGNEWVNGKSTTKIEHPVDRIETWIELISDSSKGWDPPTTSSRLVWVSPAVPEAVRAELNKKFARPEYKPWKKFRKKKRSVD